MGIAKFDDGIPEGPKFIAAGPIACWLWFASVCYARRAFTDGFIPRLKVPALILGLKHPYTHAAKLVEVGLWEDATDGYQVHHFLDWNPSKKDIEAYRAGDKERKRRVRGLSTVDTERIPDGVHEVSTTPRSTRTDAGAKSESESKSTSKDLDLRGESAREGKPIRPIAHVGLAGKHQLTCRPGTWDACARGFCVPPFVADEWRVSAEAAGLDTDAEIRACVKATLEAHTGVLAGDPSKFWRSAWAVRHGDASRPVAPRSRSLGPDYTDVFDWQEECARLHSGRCGNATFHDAKMLEAEAS